MGALITVNPILGPAIALLTEVLSFVADEKARKWNDELTKVRLEIEKEEALGYNADDAKIETLQKKIVILMEAAKNELALKRASASR